MPTATLSETICSAALIRCLASLQRMAAPANYSLLSGSLAIDQGNASAVTGVGTVPQSDQRGALRTSRVAGGRIDIGSYESQMLTPLSLVVDTLADEDDQQLFSRRSVSAAKQFAWRTGGRIRRTQFHSLPRRRPARPSKSCSRKASSRLQIR